MKAMLLSFFAGMALMLPPSVSSLPPTPSKTAPPGVVAPPLPSLYLGPCDPRSVAVAVTLMNYSTVVTCSDGRELAFFPA